MLQRIGLGIGSVLIAWLASGCGAEVTTSRGGMTTESSTVIGQGLGSLRPGIYTGSENCESKIMIESLEPIISPSRTISSITVTAEGYPAIDGLELRPGITFTSSFESGTVDLTVTSYRSLPDDEVVVEMAGEASLCGDTCYGRANNGICEEEGVCGDESFCYQGDELVLELCQPGTDCTDCQGFLTPVKLTIEQTIHYTQSSPSSLNVRTETVMGLTRPATKITTSCESQVVRAPIPAGD